MSSPAITPIDLVSLRQVKDWLGIPETNTDDDTTIAYTILAISQYVINRTGIQSFNSVQQFTDIYDGNNNDELLLNNRPIDSIISVTIGSWSVPISTSLMTPGIYITQQKKSIAFRSQPSIYLVPPQSIYPYCFLTGRGNIQVVYTAGFSRVPFDLADACMRAVAIYYRRKDWIDLASKALSAGGGSSGTTTYHKWQFPPEVEYVFNHYARYGTS